MHIKQNNVAPNLFSSSCSGMSLVHTFACLQTTVPVELSSTYTIHRAPGKMTEGSLSNGKMRCVCVCVCVIMISCVCFNIDSPVLSSFALPSLFRSVLSLSTRDRSSSPSPPPFFFLINAFQTACICCTESPCPQAAPQAALDRAGTASCVARRRPCTPPTWGSG
jgi:hypothetical protein